MTLAFAFAVVSALAAACLYGASTALEQIGSSRIPNQTTFNLFALLRFLAQPWYVLGLLCGAAGLPLAVVALRTLPLFLVQSILASSVAATALTTGYYSHIKLTTRERLAVGGVMLGIIILTLIALPGGATIGDDNFIIGLIFAPLVIAVAASLLLRASGKTGSGALLATLAGACFSGSALGVRAIVIPVHAYLLAANPLVWAVLAYTLIGTFLFTISLQRSSAVGIAAVSHACEVLIPAILGTIFLGDRIRPGLWPGTIIGCVLVVASAIELSTEGRPLRHHHPLLTRPKTPTA